MGKLIVAQINADVRISGGLKEDEVAGAKYRPLTAEPMRLSPDVVLGVRILNTSE